MVNLKELLNDFSPLNSPEERDEGYYKSIPFSIQGKNFDLQYMIQPVSLDMCLMYSSREEAQFLRSTLDDRRMILNFQFYYVEESGNKTQEVQSFPDGTIFPLIHIVGSFLKSKEDQVDTILFGGDSDTRVNIYDLFAKRISKEPPGWYVTKGSGRGPMGKPGTFWALFKKGS